MADEYDVRALVEELTEVKTEYEELKNHVVKLEKKYERMLSVKSGCGDGEINISTRLQLLTADLFNNSMFSDIDVMLQGGTQVKAHKLILAASGNDWGVEQFDSIDMLDLTDMRYEVCYAMIKWVYTDEFDFHHKINDEFLIELMQAASICKLESLFIRCQKALLAVLNSENYDKILKSSEDLSADILYEQCLKFNDGQHNKTGTELLVQKLKQHIDDQQIDLIIPDDFTSSSTINHRIQSSHNHRVLNKGNITVYLSNNDSQLDNVLNDDVVETYETFEGTSLISKSTSMTQNIDIDNVTNTEQNHLNEMLHSDSLTSISVAYDHDVEIVDIGPEHVDIGSNDEDIGPEHVDIGPDHVDIGPEHVDIGSNDEDIGPEHVDIGPDRVDIGPEHVDIGPDNGPNHVDIGPNCIDIDLEHVNIGPLMNIQHCLNSADTVVVKNSNEILQKHLEVPYKNHHFEVISEINEDVPLEEYDLGANSIQLTENVPIVSLQNHSNASLQESYVDQSEDSLHLQRDKDSVIITCNPNMEIINIEEKSDNENEVIDNFELDEAHQQIAAHEEIIETMKTKNPKKKSTEEKSNLKDFTCNVCGKVMKKNHHLMAHLRIHTGHRPFKCDLCSRAFYGKNDLKRHIRIHTGEKPYKCDVCEKAFTSNCNLKTHLKIHDEHKPFICSLCDKTFRVKSNLTAHIRIHTGEKPFRCEVCPKSFNSGTDLAIHFRTHTGEKPFPCEVCSKFFRSKSNLKEHTRVHSEKHMTMLRSSSLAPYKKIIKCDLCLKEFSSVAFKSLHLLTHPEYSIPTEYVVTQDRGEVIIKDVK